MCALYYKKYSLLCHTSIHHFIFIYIRQRTTTYLSSSSAGWAALVGGTPCHPPPPSHGSHGSVITLRRVKSARACHHVQAALCGGNTCSCTWTLDSTTGHPSQDVPKRKQMDATLHLCALEGGNNHVPSSRPVFSRTIVSTL